MSSIASAIRQVARSTKAEIMLFEQDPHARITMAYQLSQAGYAIQETGSYHDAMELFMERQRVCNQFELLIIEMDSLGLAMIQQLRMKQILVPVLIVLAFPSAGIMQLFRSIREITILVKPYGPEELLQSIAGLLNNATDACQSR